MLFHLQHAAHVPNLYFYIPRDQHDRDLAGLMGKQFSPFQGLNFRDPIFPRLLEEAWMSL